MNLLSIRIRKLLHAITSSAGRRALAAGVAASIEHKSALGRIQYRSVVDVGANVGQFALFACEQYPAAAIFSFEPLEDCWKKFGDIFEQEKRVQLFRYGVGPSDTDAAIHVTHDNDSSSILEPAPIQSEVFGTAVRTKQKIQLRRLSSLLRHDQVLPPALLKIDVQGYEIEVLKGCEELLNRFDTVYVEASYLELYKGQTLAGEVIEFLWTHGFNLRGVFNQHVDKEKGPLQADFLFEKLADQN
ncbi:FkbM family methyltransferase [Bradyrhizobium sp. GM2.2]|uniref:FkbM family methyltransferase n=1 Tax=Bradyrhizobium sp. GM2.2 TaxID=3156358 RepID=UPI0033920D0E